MSFSAYLFQNSRIPFKNEDNRAIVFIDSGVPNYDTLVQKVIPEARAILIGSQTDGIKAITQILVNSNCQEVYIVAQGYPGCLYLGNSELSINTLIQYALELQSWFIDHKSNLDISPRLSLYGCNLASGDVGEEFITKLSQITTAKIVASINTVDQEIFSNY
ncbi:DUF4347 domain-containing protein [Pleurocapsa sp. FMAR1]|uniref:DUF4347 domain-containing protein n=1 Tax=Pleurocapsa sp. FMAR1 TaxID=3040204 RepID=UPI0029C81300|nr:DUF4347 domain-containing protein [Pleurocapsa sp. FMAR1]